MDWIEFTSICTTLGLSAVNIIIYFYTSNAFNLFAGGFAFGIFIVLCIHTIVYRQ